MSRIAATGIPKFEAGPQKSGYDYVRVMGSCDTFFWESEIGRTGRAEVIESWIRAYSGIDAFDRCGCHD